MSSLLAREQAALLAAIASFRLADALQTMAPLAKPWPLTARGLQCYQANALALARRALPEAFPVLAQMLGDESFAELAADFWQQHPPARGDIAQWGGALPAFVAASPQLADTPYLADVAQVEWALHSVATAADQVLDIASFALLTEADPATYTLQCAEPLHSVASPWPVVTLVNAHRQGPDALAALPERLAGLAARDARAETALVWRQGLRPTLRQAAPGEAAFVLALQRSASLADALEAADSADAFDFNAWLPDAVQTALVTGALGPVQPTFVSANGVKTAPIKARDDGKAGALPRPATRSGAVLNPFPLGCGQKGHARRCEALPGANPGSVSRLAHDLFDSQRIWQK